MLIILWHWELNELLALASWKRELGISLLEERRANNGLRKEGVPRKTRSPALAALLHMLEESNSGPAHAVIKWGGGKRATILVTRFLCRAAEQTPRSAVTLGHNGALKSKSGGTERKCVPPGPEEALREGTAKWLSLTGLNLSQAELWTSQALLGEPRAGQCVGLYLAADI